MRFQEGDTVRIAKNSEPYASNSEPYASNSGYNPKDMDGRIIDIIRGRIAVQWGNGRQNGYDERDLKLRSRT